MLPATKGCGSSAMASADQSLQRQGQGEEEHVDATLPAHLQQRLQRGLAQQLDDTAEVLLDSEIQLSPLLKAAASKGRHELLAALLRRAAQLSRSGDPEAVAFPPPVPELSGAWLAAAEKGHVRCLSLILDTCKHRPTALKELLEECGEGGDNALMLAAWAAGPGQLECMRLLLEHSPDAQVTHVGDRRYNALMYAAQRNSAVGIELLLAHSPEQQVAALNCDGGSSALMIAALEGHAACLKLLLAHTPDQQVAAVDAGGWNALMWAASNGHASCLQLLLAHSPDAQLAVEPFGENALSAAAGFLREAKARRPTDGGGGSGGALQRDLVAGRECVELLLSHGAQLPVSASAAVRGVVWPIVQESVRRARVPDMANAAVVGLALAAAGRGKRPAKGEEGGAAAGPPPPKAARTHA